MSAILAVTVPFFALVAAGWGAGRLSLLPETAIPGLNAYVLFFALPAMLLRLGLNTPVGQLLDPAVLGCWLLAAAVVVGAVVGATRRRLGLKDAAFGALVAAFPNSGFIGVPIVVALLGDSAAGPVICVLLADLFVTTSACVALAQAHDAAGHGTRRALALALRGAVGNPLPWAVAAGAALSLAGAALPGPLATIVAMLADSATPVALFTIGAVLWRAGRRAGDGGAWRGVVPVVAVKLVVHPALVAAIGAAAVAAGAPLQRGQLVVLVLVAALPSASNVSLLAERYRADNGRVARIVLLSTAVAFFSFSALAGWLAPAAG